MKMAKELNNITGTDKETEYIIIKCQKWPLSQNNEIVKKIIRVYITIIARSRDGDRKSWDARGPMIWDNFSIFRTNCAILTSYIRADPRTCRGLLRGCCHVV